MKILFLTFGLIFFLSVPAQADCKASPFSKPDDTFGQRFNCDDGSTMTYRRSPIGDSITNNDTGERYRASGISDIGDEYNSMGGRKFGNDMRLERGGIRDDRIRTDD